VFKLVTSAALVDAGVDSSTRVCFHGGLHSLEADNLEDHRSLDRSCRSFAWGLARSQNAIIGRLAHEHLDGDKLARAGRAFDFGAPLAFEVPVAASQMELPTDGGLAFARVAAGFWQTSLSPLHGAYLAATLARDGETPPLRIVERVVDGAGDWLTLPPPPTHRAVTAETARAVAQMMIGTTEFGTAQLAFHRGGRHLLPNVTVAGKTGSLNRKGPYLAYSWFVGFAPASQPEVAVAVLLGNGENAKVKAAEVARKLLGVYFSR
jgi:cell division protein FtsI/penicillin-binding protein 2